jgi:hypothetical protein
LRKPRRESLKELHAARGHGKISRHVNPFNIFPYAVFGRDGLHKRVPVLDRGQACHAAKQIAHRTFGNHAGSEIDEGVMHVVLGNCRCDAIDMRYRHFGLLQGEFVFKHIDS